MNNFRVSIILTQGEALALLKKAEEQHRSYTEEAAIIVIDELRNCGFLKSPHQTKIEFTERATS